MLIICMQIELSACLEVNVILSAWSRRVTISGRFTSPASPVANRRSAPTKHPSALSKLASNNAAVMEDRATAIPASLSVPLCSGPPSPRRESAGSAAKTPSVTRPSCHRVTGVTSSPHDVPMTPLTIPRRDVTRLSALMC